MSYLTKEGVSKVPLLLREVSRQRDVGHNAGTATLLSTNTVRSWTYAGSGLSLREASAGLSCSR